MNQKQKTALNKLLSLYTELYPSKDVFKNNLFPYTPDELSEIIKGINDVEDANPKRPRSLIREDIQHIESVEQVQEYVSKLGLLNGTYETIEDNKAALALTLAEYKHLYSILYTTPIGSKVKKDVLINLIVKYFDGIQRAHALKP